MCKADARSNGALRRHGMHGIAVHSLTAVECCSVMAHLQILQVESEVEDVDVGDSRSLQRQT